MTHYAQFKITEMLREYRAPAPIIWVFIAKLSNVAQTLRVGEHNIIVVARVAIAVWRLTGKAPSEDELVRILKNVYQEGMTTHD